MLEPEGGNPLHIAAKRNNIEIMNLLLKYRANINIRGSYGDTPLLWACSHNNMKAVEFLVHRSADVNLLARDHGGSYHKDRSPLYYAFQSDNFIMAKFLLMNGADVHYTRPYDREYFKDNLHRTYAVFSDPLFRKYLRPEHTRYNPYYVENIERLRQMGRIPRLKTWEDRKIEYAMEKEEKNRKSRKRNLAIKLTIPPLYLGTSIFLREYTFRGNPQNNHFGTFNGMLGLSIVGGLVVGGIGLLVGTSSKSKKFSTVLGPMVFGAVVGIVAGGYLGYRYRSHFKNNRGLYYGATAVFCIPILVIRF